VDKTVFEAQHLGSQILEAESESERILAVRSLHLLDTPPEERFDRIVRLARDIFHVRYVAVNLLDEDRQFTKSAIGYQVGSVPRTTSLCAHTIDSPGLSEISDTRLDPLFKNHPATKLGVRFYAGAPVMAPTGQPVGTLCIADTEPRRLTASEEGTLQDLAAWVEREIATEDDLSHAAEVQRRLRPRRPDNLRDIDVGGACVPSLQVGGDFYDWQWIDGRLQVVIADVMGKGLSAALIAAGLRATMRGTSRYNDLSNSVARTARSILEDLGDTESFVTLFASRIDPATGDLEYIDAGHGLAAIVSPGGDWRQLSGSDLPMGILPDQQWKCQHDRLAADETLIMVSDGVLDVFANGKAAMEQAIIEVAKEDECQKLAEAIVELAKYRRSADDVTAVTVRRPMVR